tara:strand:- start:4755 stop:5105 length:351 start_codon:yes stop_codon:yes gene_type:complete
MVEKLKQHSPFVIDRREAVLTFSEDSEFHGLEVRARLDVDVGTFLEFQKLGADPSGEDTRTLFEKFGETIILEWNMYDDDAKRVPTTAAGFMSLPPNVCVAVIGAWAEHVTTAGEG